MRPNKDIVYTGTNLNKTLKLRIQNFPLKSLSSQEERKFIDHGNQSKAKMWIFVVLHCFSY